MFCTSSFPVFLSNPWASFRLTSSSLTRTSSSILRFRSASTSFSPLPARLCHLSTWCWRSLLWVSAVAFWVERVSTRSVRRSTCFALEAEDVRRAVNSACGRMTLARGDTREKCVHLKLPLLLSEFAVLFALFLPADLRLGELGAHTSDFCLMLSKDLIQLFPLYLDFALVVNKHKHSVTRRELRPTPPAPPHGPPARFPWPERA